MILVQCTIWWFMHTWHMGIWVAYGGFKRLRDFLDQINIDCLDTHIVSQIADSHRGDSSSLHVRRQYFLYQRLFCFGRPSIRNDFKMVIPIVSFAWFLMTHNIGTSKNEMGRMNYSWPMLIRWHMKYFDHAKYT